MPDINLVYRKSTTPTTNGATAFKGSPLTNDELDNNFYGINVEMLTKAPINNAVFTGSTTIPNIIASGGTIDGTVIGGTSPVAGTFTTVTTTGNLTVGDATGDILSIRAGTALLPALTTVGDLNTGMWFPAADTIAWSTNGGERLRLADTGATIANNLTVTGDAAVNGGDLTTSATTFNLLDTTATTLNLARAATAITIGATTGTTTVRNNISVTGTGFVGSSMSIGGAATLSSTLAVTGATTLSSTLGVTGVSTLNSAVVTNSATVGTTLGVTGATTLSNTLGVTGATTLNSTLGVTGATTLSSTLGVTGATTLSSTLGVTGATTLSSTLGVTGAATLSSTLAVTGATTLNSNVTLAGSVTPATEYFRITDGAGSPVTKFLVDSANGNTSISGTLGVTGATTLSSTLGVTGVSTLNSAVVTNSATVGTTLAVTGATTLSSTLGVTGVSTLNSAVVTNSATVGTTLGVTGATTLSSTLGVTGATTLSSTLGVTGASTLAAVGAASLTVSGATTLAAMSATTGSFSGQVTSTVAGGTAPLVVTSTTRVTNLNADKVDGLDFNSINTSGTPGVDQTGGVVYAVNGTTIGFVPPGISGYILQSGGTGSTPSWVAQDNLSAGNSLYSANVLGGSAGQILYQGALDTTNKLPIGAANTVLTSSGSIPQWSTSLSLAGTLGVTGAATLSSSLGLTGNLTINTNKFTVTAATGNTVIAGTVSHTGLTPTDGTNIDQIYTETDIGLVVTTGWVDTKVNAAELAAGSYLVQVSTGFGANLELHTGVMSWFAGDANTASGDEIVLHRASAGSDTSNLFLRVFRSATTTTDMVLQISASSARTAATYIYRFRRMI